MAIQQHAHTGSGVCQRDVEAQRDVPAEPHAVEARADPGARSRPVPSPRPPTYPNRSSLCRRLGHVSHPDFPGLWHGVRAGGH